MRIEIVRKIEADQLQLQLLQAQATASSGSGPSTQAAGASAVGPSPKKVKVATVADQANDMEVTELSAADVQAAYRRYTKNSPWIS